ncbi:MAG: hypothetical protein ACYTEV_03895 [Planctomycetota bacterium]|jgi:hypothetical protein
MTAFDRCRSVGVRAVRAPRRRGVSSILAMLYLVMFGSLAAAMAVVAQSNLRTADSAMRVSRAMSAAETGLVFGVRRLNEQASRFVVLAGTVDADLAFDLWTGGLPSDEVDVLPAVGYSETTEPSGIMQAIAYVHEDVDAHWFDAEAGDALLPNVDTDLGVLEVKPISLGESADDPYFRLRYEILADEPAIRVTSIGVDRDLTRQVSMDFRLAKRIEYAVVTPNRLMIGKNVMVEGPIGTRYGVFADGSPNEEELDLPNGDPMTIRSDFYGLDADLDTLLDAFYAAVVDYDVDGDSRLRPSHPDEGIGVASNDEFVDWDGNEYVDDFDLFLATFDADGDGRVVYDGTLAYAAGYGSLDEEYGPDAGEDLQLMRLIDESRPDRNGDGVFPPVAGNDKDRILGWQDGVVDALDQYAKVRGRVMFGVTRADWEDYHGESYQTEVQGPIMAPVGEAPLLFEVNDERMIELTTGMFADSRTWFEDQVPASPVTDISQPPADESFIHDQATTVGTFTLAADMDPYESVPFGSPGAYDYYQRPVFENYTFENLRIPRGSNALFINCTFAGVTWIETLSVEDTEGTWNYTGAYNWQDDDLDGIPDDGELTLGKFREPGDPYSPMTAPLPDGTRTNNTRLYSNNLRFDSCTFLGSVAGDRIGSDDPDDRTYTHWRNKVQFTGDTRFYIDPNDPDLLDQPDVDVLRPILLAMNDADREQLATSSIMLPGWSVDIGSFDAFAPRVNLKGTIVAGVLDIRGRAEIRGTMLMTYRPARNEGPLLVMGSINVDRFNTTIGYFSSDDGDSEGSEPVPGEFGEIRLIYEPPAGLPDGIPWPVSVRAVQNSYAEGGMRSYAEGGLSPGS